MKANFLLAFIFLAILSAVMVANINNTDLIGCTELNGRGCVCHNLERDSSVSVWVEGPESLYIGQTGLYKMFLTGGPAEAGGYNVAGRFGRMVLVDSFSYQNQYALNELTQAFALPFPTPEDTIYWNFGYTASDSSAQWDTIYSCGLSLVWDSIPDFHDRWNFGPKFPVRIFRATDVDENLVRPEGFVLYQNYPNPFNPTTKISWQSAVSSWQTLKVYDILGKEISTLVDEYRPAGRYEVDFDASGLTSRQGSALTSGIYYYRIQAGNYSETKKMILLK